MNNYFKFLLGVVLQIVRIVALMLIEYEARHLYADAVHILGRGWCLALYCQQLVDGHTQYQILSSMSFILFGVGAYEFFCAQTPYVPINGSAIVFLLVGYGISEPCIYSSLD